MKSMLSGEARIFESVDAAPRQIKLFTMLNMVTESSLIPKSVEIAW